MKQKLNVKRTFFIGLAFFAILMLWRVHLTQTPLLLRQLLQDQFGYEDGEYFGIIGIIMSIDNLFAIVLLPLFGLWSDKTKNRLGKRMTFIVAGAILSAIFFPLMAGMFLIGRVGWFIAMLALMKVSMNLWRGPAVALMPDITPKPFRAKANAIINFVGYIGAIIGGGLVMFMPFILDNPDTHVTGTIPFYITAVIMVAIVILLLFRFKENRVLEEMKEQMEIGENFSETQEKVEPDKRLSKRDKLNLWIVMGAVFMAWFAFNAIDTFGSNFEQDRFNPDRYEGFTPVWPIMGIAMAVVALLSFLPCIKLTKKIGRKNSVLIGMGIVLASLTLGAILTPFISSLTVVIPIFALSGVGWALINISAFPIVVEMASLKNIAFLTGIYYVATQSAQFLTSVIFGVVLWQLSDVYTSFFWWYGVFFMVLAFILCLFFKPRKVSLETAKDVSHIDNEDIETVETVEAAK